MDVRIINLASFPMQDRHFKQVRKLLGERNKYIDRIDDVHINADVNLDERISLQVGAIIRLTRIAISNALSCKQIVVVALPESPIVAALIGMALPEYVELTQIYLGIIKRQGNDGDITQLFYV